MPEENNKKKRDEAKYAHPQEQLPPHTVSLEELYNKQWKYMVLPEFQRTFCWNLHMQQNLIDTILSGESVGQLEGYSEFNEKGEQIWRLIDGCQRTNAIVDYMSGKYKTWSVAQKSRRRPNSGPPIEPGKFYDQLNPIARTYLNEYRLTINKTHKTEMAALTERFLDLQNALPTNAAERLHAYSSQAKNLADQLTLHPFWEIFYDGPNDRQQVFQYCLHLILLELAFHKEQKIIMELGSTIPLHTLVSGKRDHELFPGISEQMECRLDLMADLFDGLHYSLRTASVVMYQTVLYLENVHYVQRQQDRGVLAPWLRGLIAEAKRPSLEPNWANPIHKMLGEQRQKAFWAVHLSRVCALVGVHER